MRRSSTRLHQAVLLQILLASVLVGSGCLLDVPARAAGAPAPRLSSEGPGEPRGLPEFDPRPSLAAWRPVHGPTTRRTPEVHASAVAPLLGAGVGDDPWGESTSVLGMPGDPRQEELALPASDPGVAPPVDEPDSCPGESWDPIVPTRGPVTDPFGWSSWRGRNHDGLDFGVPTGTPVRAAEGGRVIRAGWDAGYGQVVFVEHGNGYLTTYNHLSQVRVQPGQRICKGDTLALSGATGKGTGPHLHFEVWVPGPCSYPGVGARCPRDPSIWI